MKPRSCSVQPLKLAALLLGIFVAAQTGFAQGVSSETTPKVTEFSGELRIDREVTLTVAHLSDWASNHDPQKLVLFLNGRRLKNVYPEQIDLSANQLRFHLRASDVSQPVWSDLLHEPRFYRPVTVSVGLEGQSPFDTIFDYNNRLNLTVIPKIAGTISLMLVLVSIPLFLLLVRATDIIREHGPPPPQGKGKRYSLGRTQTAFWFFLVSITYVCLGLITGDFNTLTPSVLALIGINALAAVTSRVMRGKDNVGQLVNGNVQNRATNEITSRGFFTDILSDTSGYSFHRFQMVAWNVVFGILFIFSVYHKLAMPIFSKAVLALIGISAVTFIGFESVEQRVFQRMVAAGR